ncbi:toll/interleukin-1 receptor domain-containing protein [Streptomyces sp. STR69]|uniref:toll/interleukin-1 receptor domain-containing protein n=1 Tax=Streptomyces sp. STR69 TaxID=1796942 RepID=UPI0021CAC5D0|nr:toll/interleukin-1 receptor domain-containing protein [Streptomyces sp. STR69]
MDPAAFFYTSCVRADGWRALTRFHTDLEYQLRIQEGFGVSGVLGALMEPESAREGDVTRAGVMIALYSPRYFRDRGAGLEWSVFRSRMRHHEDTRGVPARGCLIPLCWKPVTGDEVPEAVRKSVEIPGAFDWLRQYGLESLAASSESEDEARYYALVEQLAKTIAEAGRTDLEPLDAPDARELSPEFGSEGLSQDRESADAAEVPEEALPADEEPEDTGIQARGPRSVAISYVGADQPWADWMKEVLEQRGYEVRQRRWRAGREDLRDAVAQARDEAERLVVIFSRNYFAAGDTSPTDWAEVFVESRDRASPDVLVQIDATPRPLLVRDAQVVVLAGADLLETEELIGELLPEPPQRSEDRGSGR